jgi:preprotein translocase subunit SecA
MSELHVDAALSPYPERADRRPGWTDRLYALLEWPVAALLHRVQRAGAGARAPRAPVAHGLGLEPSLEKSEQNLAISAGLAGLRARLSVSGVSGPPIEDALLLVAEVAQRVLRTSIPAAERHAARAIILGGLAEAPRLDQARAAALAAAVVALAGLRAHVLFASAPQAVRELERFAPIFSELGLSSGHVSSNLDRQGRQATYGFDVVFAFCREVAFDYLRDRIILRGRPGPVQLKVEALTSPTPRLEQLLLPGLQFAIVVGADTLMVDEARTPVAISADGDIGQEHRLLREALRMSEGFAPGMHYHFSANGMPSLSASGETKLAELAAGASGPWSGKQRREYLMRLTLAARPLRAGHEYLVAHDRIEMAPDVMQAMALPPADQRLLIALLEVREDLAPLAARENIARLSMQRFYRRYLRVGGTVTSANGVRAELWKVFRLAVRRAREAPRATRLPLQLPRQVFGLEDEKLTALDARVASFLMLGHSVAVVARTVEFAHEFAARLAAQGIEHRLLVGRQDENEITQFVSLGQSPGVVVMVAHAATGASLGSVPAGHPGVDLIVGQLLESRRAEQRIYQRFALEGVQVSAQCFASLGDALVSDYCWAALLARARAAPKSSRSLWKIAALRLTQLNLGQLERTHRRDLLKREDYLGDVLSFSGNQG